MGRETDIAWTRATWNPWHGCQKVSEGCRFCYMMRDKERHKQDGTLVLRSKTKFYEPQKWADPLKIFTCSWSDFFIPAADQWRDEAWEVIKSCPQHTFQILTKRPERIPECLPPDWGRDGYPNVWLGVSVEEHVTSGRIGELMKIPAVVRFSSFEPLIGPVYWSEEFAQLDWIIIGGESGNDVGKWLYRKMSLAWAQALMDAADSCGIPVFFKQMGTYQAKQQRMKSRHGSDMAEWHTCFRRQEFPKKGNDQKR